MTTQLHSLAELFAQLGLSSDESDIKAFVAKHSPLSLDIELWEASFWTPAQASLLRDECLEDADWSDAVDQLNLALRARI